MYDDPDDAPITVAVDDDEDLGQKVILAIGDGVTDQRYLSLPAARLLVQALLASIREAEVATE